jgi:hypothetical protein
MEIIRSATPAELLEQPISTDIERRILILLEAVLTNPNATREQKAYADFFCYIHATYI